MTDNSRGTITERLDTIAKLATSLPDRLERAQDTGALRSAMYTLSGMVLELASIVADMVTDSDDKIRNSLDALQ